MTRPLILLAFLSVSFSSIAQDSCFCCTSEYRLFDFWVGDWNVYDTTGTQIGENTVTKSVQDCLIMEHWRGSDNSEGKSINFYDNKDKTWNQIWIDHVGSQLILKGEGDDDQMVMRSDLVPGQRFHLYRNEVTWTLEEDGSVSQVWQLLDKDDQVINTVFHGVYKRK